MRAVLRITEVWISDVPLITSVYREIITYVKSKAHKVLIVSHHQVTDYALYWNYMVNADGQVVGQNILCKSGKDMSYNLHWATMVIIVQWIIMGSVLPLRFR